MQNIFNSCNNHTVLQSDFLLYLKCDLLFFNDLLPCKNQKSANIDDFWDEWLQVGLKLEK